ncbi:MAG: amidohydrolase family protein [Xanthomonadales bacterium]|nr:amidohydrolase family protein [Xanthomonadales bacterium]
MRTETMKSGLRLASLGLLLSAGLAQALPPKPAPVQSQPVALIGGIVHVGNGQVLQNAQVLLRDGHIEAVGSAAEVSIPAEAQRIDVSGQHVYPGLILLGSDLGLVEVEAVRATVDTAELGSFNPNVRAADAYNVDSELIPVTRYNGILTAQIAPEGGVISGRSATMQLDAWTAEDALLRADDGLWLNWPPVRALQFDFATFSLQLKDNPEYGNQIAELESLFAQARGRLDSQDASPNLKLVALAAVLRGESRLFVRTEQAADFERAVRFAERHGIEQLAWYGGAEAMQLAPLLRARQIPVVIGGIHRTPQYADTPFDDPYRLAAQLHEAGVTVAISYPGTMNARNLPFIVGTAIAYGVPAEAALGMVSQVPAQLLGLGDQLGTIEAGKRATLFVSAGDAFEMSGNDLKLAFINGRQIDLEGRQQQLYQRYHERYGAR